MSHPYGTGERPDVYAELPESVRSVLDVGCGRGGLCKLVKTMHPNAQVWGMESHPGAASEASQHADRIIVGRFPDDLPEETPAFDVVVFADVLEHLLEPAEALLATHKILSTDGVVVASIPNLRHWSAFKQIFVHGDFRYVDTGLFDRTHVRWFTRKSMLRLFADCGYTIERCVPTSTSSRLLARVLRTLTRGLGEELTALQYIITARPRSRYS